MCGDVEMVRGRGGRSVAKSMQMRGYKGKRHQILLEEIVRTISGDDTIQPPKV